MADTISARIRYLTPQNWRIRIADNYRRPSDLRIRYLPYKKISAHPPIT
jgi:hypothetical protein